MPKKYIKTGQTPEGRARRLRAFEHNSYLGYAMMMQKQCLKIIHADTTTDEAKDTAASILGHLSDLSEQLKIWVD